MTLSTDKIDIYKYDMYVGRDYLTEGLFKLNVATIVPKYMNEKISSFSDYVFK